MDSSTPFIRLGQYYQHDPLPRRATEPVTLAPTASMIDPNLEDHRPQHSQLPLGFVRPQMHSHAVLSNGINATANGMKSNVNNSPERTLPSKDVNENSIDDAYVKFIMYCNPSIPANVDTTELRKGFRAPPKSDGKSFSTFTLFGLISRLDSLKSWSSLVLELGVEQPDPTKNQSSQKVQQYAVRLKRWLKAFHVDAFFNYLIGKPSPYIEERPTKDESLAERERDGIPTEEDLAIRALLPEWRPKRGRRKAEDIEAEAEANAANKKVHVRSSSADFTSMFDEQYSAAPSSAMPWSAQPQQPDPWAAAQVAIAPKTPGTGQTPIQNQLSAQGNSQQMRWRFDNIETPSSPYPQSAITARHTFSASPSFDEPESAHPSTNASKSPSRARKKHGPAVSSAWPSTTSTASGKTRGRPPSNRSVQDGPFSTFPANPNAKDSSPANIGTLIRTTPSPSRELEQNLQPGLSIIQPNHSEQNLPRKPNKLQLQVPEHSGGPVRLATPPRVLINGEINRQATHTHERRSSADFFNHLDEVSEEDGMEDGDEEEQNVDWKRRALTLKRKLMEKEEELKAMKRRVLDAVM